MRAGSLMLFLWLPTLCLGAEISGVWATDSHRVKPKTATPVSIQIEQASDHLFILKIMASPGGRLLEQRDYLIHRDVEINVTAEGIELDFYTPPATWFIDSRGALVVRRCGAGSLVLSRSTDLIQ